MVERMARWHGYMALAVAASLALLGTSRGTIQFILLPFIALVPLPAFLLTGILLLYGSIQERFQVLRPVATANAALLGMFGLLSAASVTFQAASIEKMELEGLVALFFCLYFTLLWTVAAVAAAVLFSRQSSPAPRLAATISGLLLVLPVLLALLTLRVLAPLAWIGFDLAERVQLARAGWRLIFNPASLVPMAIVLLSFGAMCIVFSIGANARGGEHTRST